MMTTRRLLPLLFLASTALGCGKKDEPASDQSKAVEPTEAEVTATRVAAEQVAEPEVEQEAEAEAEIPTAADFEGQAVEEISAESLEKELTAIEKELAN